MRRSIAVVGIFALAMTLVPSMPGAAAEALDCCNGIMCPLHSVQAHAPDCGMDMHGLRAALNPCPVQTAAHYTGATVFVLVAPMKLNHHGRSEPAIALLPNLSPDAECLVDSPPPRLPLKA